MAFNTNNDLLIYNSDYMVLICRECKYAVQKSALGSHLLRHKVYRGERQRLLSYLARLEILEPDHVRRPVAGSPPVHGIPVIPGYRCTYPSCDSLYASSKRMRRHWSETHGIRDPPDSSSTPAHLQTFFKGTKIRYFEVTTPSSSSSPSSSTMSSGVLPALTSPADLHGDFNSPIAANPPATSETRTILPNPSPSLSSTLSISPSIDLATLQYLHHYTTITSLTLPLPNHDPSRIAYWSVEVVRLALSLQDRPNHTHPSYLMAGLLSLGANHLASLSLPSSSHPIPEIATTSHDSKNRETHLRAAKTWTQAFIAGWKHVVSQLDMSRDNREEARAAAQIIRIQWCCSRLFDDNWMMNDSHSHSHSHQDFALLPFTQTLQGIVNPNYALRMMVGFGFGGGSDDLSRVFPSKTTNTQPSNTGRQDANANTENNIPPALLNRVRGLTMNMSNALGKPDSAMDFFATLSATDLLLDCLSLSYSASSFSLLSTFTTSTGVSEVGAEDGRQRQMHAAWLGMETWLRQVTEHLNTMVAQKKPAGLVVMAHWSLLLERTERSGGWFLKGAADAVRRQVVRELPADGDGAEEIRGLVENWPDL